MKKTETKTETAPKKEYVNIQVNRGIFVSPEDIEDAKEITYKWDYRERGLNGKFVTKDMESTVPKNNSGGFSFTYPEGPKAGSMIVLVESPKGRRKKKAVVNGESIIDRVEYYRESLKVTKGVILSLSKEMARKFSDSNAVKVVL